MARERLGFDVNIEMFGVGQAEKLMKILASKNANQIGALKNSKRRAVRRLGFKGQALWKKNVSGPSGARTLGIRTGRFRRDIRLKFSREKDRARLFTLNRSARIHEYGGTIRAKRAPFLVFKIGDQFVSVKSVTMPERPHFRPMVKELDKASPKIHAKELDRGIAAAEKLAKQERRRDA